MKLKEKCIYYDPLKDGYYLVLSVSSMIFGRYGEMENPNYLDNYMNQGGTGLRFKIDNILINMEYYRNYYLDDKELNEFVLVKELTDKEFYPMELLIHSRFSYSEGIIDIHEVMDNVTDLVSILRKKKSELKKLEKEIGDLENQLFNKMIQ